MENKMEIKVQELYNHLSKSYENMTKIVNDLDYLKNDAVTGTFATMVAIGLAKNYVGYLNGEFETIDEATTTAMADAQKVLTEEE
tara:strand:+ start:884 stop:1138 length:255 start_codon:yes stop_codon:yes gene_type:complete